MNNEDDCQMTWAVENMTESTHRDTIRLLALLYKLSDGKAGVSIDENLIAREASNIGLFDMSDEEFIIWHNKVIEDLEQKKN